VCQSDNVATRYRVWGFHEVLLNTSRFLTATGNPEGSCCPSMPELDDAALALLREARTDRKAQRRLIGRPHPIVRLPRRRRPGLLKMAPGIDRQSDTG
jgi:hypothetical protein